MKAQTTVEEVIGFLLQCKKRHYYCEDSWYSCPQAVDGCSDEKQGNECNCGADAFNQEIDDFIKKLEGESDDSTNIL